MTNIRERSLFAWKVKEGSGQEQEDFSLLKSLRQEVYQIYLTKNN